MFKQLLSIISGSKKIIFFNAFFQWISLISGILFNIFLTYFLYSVLIKREILTLPLICAGIAALVLKFLGIYVSEKFSFKLTEDVKKKLRRTLLEKIFRVGINYTNFIPTANLIQLSTEGIEQLQAFYSRFLPQLVYALLSSITLFIAIFIFNASTALVLLACVPLIPLLVMLALKIADKTLGKYWGSYFNLGDLFLENLQGLTTLKIFNVDGYMNERMNQASEDFRKKTMRVLFMQLNSITLMDIVAFGGAAIGIVTALLQYKEGAVSFWGMLVIFLLTFEFFVPLRILGSYVHLAMTGIAAGKRIFRILDFPEADESVNANRKIEITQSDIAMHEVNFSFDQKKRVLEKITLDIKPQSLTAIVGLSGSGKSTIISLICGYNKNYEGSIKIGGEEIKEMPLSQSLQEITLVSNNSFLFKGSIRENLAMAKETATDEEMIEVLKKVNLWDFLKEQNGLDTQIREQGNNFSGGQQQRLTIARALLKESKIYIFDESTSNVDRDSEAIIMNIIKELSKSKTVLIITHRLSNVVDADCIYFLEKGEVAESGTFDQLMKNDGAFSKLYPYQIALENYGK